MSDYDSLLEAARKSRLVLVKDLVKALEVEIAERNRTKSALDLVMYYLAWARSFIEEATGEDPKRLQATEARMAEVFGPHDGEAHRG